MTIKEYKNLSCLKKMRYLSFQSQSKIAFFSSAFFCSARVFSRKIYLSLFLTMCKSTLTKL